MLRTRPTILIVMLLAVVAVLGCSSEIVWKEPAAPGAYLPEQASVVPSPAPVYYQNPALIPTGDHEFVWETIADVVDDYFRIEKEQPVRLVGQIPTDGVLTTFPEVGSTIFEPWRHDSVGRREKIECTLQSIRRQAEVHVFPEQNGYMVEVIVNKELEDLRGGGNMSAGSATFRYDSSLTRVVDSLAEQDPNEGWIPQGRDPALEQRILSEILARTGAAAYR